MRPGNLRTYGECSDKPGNLGFIPTDAILAEPEVGYIPEHVRYSPYYFPYNLQQLQLRDPRTFNILMF